jgi:Tfp pilus assembly protein PilX
MVMLVMLVILGISAIRTSALQERMAGGGERLATTFQGAETGITVAIEAATGDNDVLTLASTKSDPVTLDYKIVDGKVCEVTDSACLSGVTETAANKTTLDISLWYVERSEKPPPGYSLDNNSQLTTYNFLGRSIGRHGSSRSEHYQGIAKIGPKGS